MERYVRMESVRKDPTGWQLKYGIWFIVSLRKTVSHLRKFSDWFLIQCSCFKHANFYCLYYLILICSKVLEEKKNCKASRCVNCLSTEFFLVLIFLYFFLFFSGPYLLHKSPYLVQIQENTNQRNSVFGHFSRSVH